MPNSETPISSHLSCVLFENNTQVHNRWKAQSVGRQTNWATDEWTTCWDDTRLTSGRQTRANAETTGSQLYKSQYVCAFVFSVAHNIQSYRSVLSSHRRILTRRWSYRPNEYQRKLWVKSTLRTELATYPSSRSVSWKENGYQRTDGFRSWEGVGHGERSSTSL